MRRGVDAIGPPETECQPTSASPAAGAVGARAKPACPGGAATRRLTIAQVRPHPSLVDTRIGANERG